ncbi:serine/threonine-protein phosphatase 6 regulatory ankyrin repeat subunit A-like isoform X2 [Corticium candelabrum]|uniref:serine/threonine-protein phosphatase 6 regulatory ankyrin repeat subunit A-like isoform X2 n=1 Tax=Corticium candelabrum TaxID=121492 RepID=UPI002E26B2B3|nr:serine/threonine-protein phosphatase 6 regulatory ankyrin repeat subunit A-like isoform X2 [Corticium candelabrum]
MITVACDDGYPIHLACHCSSLDVIRLLISHHSPLNKFNSFGCTPLMVCCQSGLYQTVQLLLDTGADPNLVSPISKKTAMHWAANRRDLQRVWLLLQFGGDQRTRKDGLNVTPRQMAERQLARMRRKGGAGYTPLGFASPRDVMCLREMMDSLNYFDVSLPLFVCMCLPLSLHHAPFCTSSTNSTNYLVYLFANCSVHQESTKSINFPYHLHSECTSKTCSTSHLLTVDDTVHVDPVYYRRQLYKQLYT